MVSSMYALADDHPRLAVPVLMKIALNVAEAEEIRVAAVDLIILSRPCAPTLQSLAMSTHNEPNPSVKSAIISGIQSAAADYSADETDQL